MVTDSFIHDLRRIVGDTQVKVNRAGTELYSYDASLAWGQPGVDPSASRSGGRDLPTGASGASRALLPAAAGAPRRDRDRPELVP